MKTKNISIDDKIKATREKIEAYKAAQLKKTELAKAKAELAKITKRRANVKQKGKTK